MWWFKRKVTYTPWKAYKQDMNSKEDILFMHITAKQSLENSGGETCGNQAIDPLQPISSREVQ